MYKRYALFYTPAAGPSEEAGATWLGWCSRRARAFDPVGMRVERPAKYGLHGTLVAPFVLAEGFAEADAIDAVRNVARALSPVALEDGLTLTQQHGFFAFRPNGDAAELNALAATCVRAFHPLRQMPDVDELARRRRANLSARQEANLVTWGYPYVMDDFNFHITLTSRVKHDAETVEAKLKAHFAEVRLVPFVVDAITLLGERPDGRFVQLDRVSLTSSNPYIASSE